jgi:co-chaperonin GroES (HSP10)
MSTAIKARPKIKIHPLEDRAVILPTEEAESMRGPLYIPDTAKEKPTRGEVIAVGPGFSRMTSSKKMRPDSGRSKTCVKENSACSVEMS